MNKKQARKIRNQRNKQFNRIGREQEAVKRYIKELKQINLQYLDDAGMQELADADLPLDCVWCDEKIAGGEIRDKLFIGIDAGREQATYYAHSKHFYDAENKLLAGGLHQMKFMANTIREREVLERTGIIKPEDFERMI